MQSLAVNHALSQDNSRQDDANGFVRTPLKIGWADIKMPLLYMLCLALVGLHFFPALVFIAIFWVWAWKNDRDQLFAMTFLFFGSFGILSYGLLPVKASDFGLMAGFLGLLIVRKPLILKKSLLWYAVFVLGTLWIASYSVESIKVQLRNIRGFLGFISVMVPFLVYTNKKFDIRRLYQVFMTYFLLMCAFYMIDAYIFKGNILVPGTFLWDDAESTFLEPYLDPFRLTPLRKYPPGMFIFGILIIPVARMYRFNVWQILLMVGGAMSTQTATLMGAVFICLTVFQGSIKRFFQVFLLGIVALLLVIGADYMLPYDKQRHESSLRIRSTFEQFEALMEATDDIDLAEFMSGRIGQILPLIDLVEARHAEWTGLGFVRTDQSQNSALEYINEYVSDIEKAEKSGVDVEISQVQLWAWAGWFGVILTTLFYGGLMVLVRKMRYRSIYYASLMFCFIMGIGGFCGIENYYGVYVVSTAYAIVLLAHRTENAVRE